MYSAYGEFLSLANIDSAVDGLFKAYLDTVLIGLKIASDASPTPTYLPAVERFRAEKLDPFTRPRGETMLPESERSKLEKRLTGDDSKRDRVNQAKDYLYWFDLRARFWEQTPIDDQIRSMIADPKDLLRLRDAANELQNRRARALQAQATRVPSPVSPPVLVAVKGSGLPLFDSIVIDLDKLASIPPPPPPPAGGASHRVAGQPSESK